MPSVTALPPDFSIINAHCHRHCVTGFRPPVAIPLVGR